MMGEGTVSPQWIKNHRAIVLERHARSTKIELDKKFLARKALENVKITIEKATNDGLNKKLYITIDRR